MLSWWSNTWLSLGVKMSNRHRQEKFALAQELSAADKQIKLLKSLLGQSSEKVTALENKVQMLQRMAAHRVVGDAERFLREG